MKWSKYPEQLNAIEDIVRTLNTKSTKAQLLDGIAEARAILNGDAK